jgi:hypothetical protein
MDKKWCLQLEVETTKAICSNFSLLEHTCFGNNYFNAKVQSYSRGFPKNSTRQFRINIKAKPKE